MINENDAKTLGIVPDKEKKLHTYHVKCYLVNGNELNFTLDNVPLERNEALAAVCTDRFIGLYNESDFNIRGFTNDESVCINMNLVTHVDIKEITND